MKRLNKEYSLDVNEYIDVKYGSIDKLNPVVIYVTCKGWVCPECIDDYDNTIDSIFNEFKKKLKKSIHNSPYFENRFVCDFDLRTASVRENKKNYISFEFFIKQRDKIYSLKEIRKTMKETFKGIIDDLVYNLEKHTLKMTKTK